MSIELFKQHLMEKRAVKIIAGIDNFDIENIKKVVTAAETAGASAVDISAKPEIISEIREMTDMPIFVSSIVPSELVKAVELGADAIELGNFDVLYKKGISFSADEVLSLVKETLNLLGDTKTFFSVTIPGGLAIADQIELARKLETMEKIEQVMPEAYKNVEDRDKFLASILKSATKRVQTSEQAKKAKELEYEYDKQLPQNQQSLDDN